MSGQNAERLDEPVTADSRLDAILEQLNALGGSAASSRAQERPLRSVQTAVAGRAAAPNAIVEDDRQTVSPSPEQPPRQDVPVTPGLELVPPPVEPIGDVVLNTPVEQEAVMQEATEMVPPPVRDVAPVELIPPPIEPEPELVAPEPEPELVVPEPELVDDASDADDTLEAHAEAEDEDSLVFELEAELASESPPTPPPVPLDSDVGWVSHEASSSVQEAVSEAPFDEPDWSDLIDDTSETSEELAVEFKSVAVEASESLLAVEPQKHVETEESVPQLDFTGVWADTTDSSAWGDDPSLMGALPEPIEGNGAGVSVGRNDLDSLRPDEEQTAVKEENNLTRKLQFLAVMLFGLIALAVVLLNDPRAVEELRAIYDGFFG